MKKFKKIYIEITNSCNLTCSFCPGTERIKEFMKPELFEKILQQINHAADYLYFHVMGEPLLHPQIGEFFDLADKYEYKVNLTTNGTLIDKALSIIEKPALRQVNFSLQSGEGTDSSQYLSGIFNFTDKAASQDRPLICMRLWNLTEKGSNPQNKVLLEQISKKFGISPVLENKTTHVRGIKLAENVFFNQAQAFSWPSLDDPKQDGPAYCYGLRDQAAILVDGTVVPCCLDREGVITLGNIKRDSLETIVSSPRAKAVYDGFSRKEAVENLCKKCTFRKRFTE